MSAPAAVHRLDQHLRLRLADLDDAAFERFFLGFFNAVISLVIDRDGERIERRVIEANTYAAGSGRAQKGIDLIAKMEGGEVWVFQCKRHKEWSVRETKTAIAAATYPAQHYFLLVACDPHKDVQDEVDKHPNWSFWNLDRICDEFRQRVPKSRQPQVLTFLAPEELKRFAPYASDALVLAGDYFEKIPHAPHSFHHGYRLVGRAKELAALEKFASDKKAKVLMLSAPGGAGKSRLLREFAQRFESAGGASEVFVLNPHATGDLTLALWDSDTPRIIVVDDAHHLERVSHELLGRVAEAPGANLILATRPQGNEALDERLREHGLGRATPIELLPLGKKDQAALAAEALGPKHETRAQALVALTGGSPFLTVMAGDMVRRGSLRWGQWHSDDEFRAAVFHTFETENLAGLAEADRKHAARLLRILAMVAPVVPDAVFHERASACLGVPRVEVEALLRRLQVAGIVSAEKSNLRVIPDLFADFLVFDTAFDAKHRLPEFARTVLEQFNAQAVAVLRNLAEASWVAQTEAVGREELIRPLFEAELARFEATSFFKRGQMLEQWAEFSVYLPKESLELANKALALTTVTPRATPEFRLDLDEGGLNSHRYVKGSIPRLLKPVALWHDAYRAEALDLLWQLGVQTPLGILGGAANHPWNVIAEVVKFAPRKPISTIEATLQWLAELVQRPSALSELEKNRSIITTLLEPCFARSVQFSQWQGRTVSWWTERVDIARTAPLRDHALAILRWVIDNGPWLAALNAVHAIEQALERVAESEAARAKDVAQLRQEWRPERLKALAVLEHALARHPEPVVAFAVRQILLRDIAYEEDGAFAAAAREVLAKITETTDLRVLAVINSQGYFEFAEELGAPKTEETRTDMMRRWHDHIEALADELLANRPQAADVINYLEGLAQKCLSAGCTPNFAELFAAMSRRQPSRARDLVAELIRRDSGFRLSAAWQQFLHGFVDQTHAQALLDEAAEHPRSEVRRGVIEFFRFRGGKDMILSEAEKTLLEHMAARAHTGEILPFVQLVQWIGESCADWGFRLLGSLSLADLGAEVNGEILAALNPYRARSVVPPLSTVQHVLDALVAAPEIKVDHYGGGWKRVVELYPRAVYEFVLKRAAHYEQLGSDARYHVLPRGTLERFELEGLATEPDFPAICASLWGKVCASLNTPMGYVWRELFQGAALDHEQYWLPQLTAAIAGSRSLDELRGVLEILHFDGSLVIFRQPELTRTILSKARDLDGAKGYENIRSNLYVISGPSCRGFSNGELDRDSDYVEAEAIKDAASHAQDPILGPFYRWIVEVEQHERARNRRWHQADMAAMDDA